MFWYLKLSDRKCPRGFYTSDFLFIFMFFHCFLPIAFRVFSSHQACACTDAFFLCRHPDHPRLPRLPQRQRRVFTELGHYPSRQLLVKTKEASCAARNTICHERGSCDGLLAVFRLCVPFSFEFTQFSWENSMFEKMPFQHFLKHCVLMRNMWFLQSNMVHLPLNPRPCRHKYTLSNVWSHGGQLTAWYHLPFAIYHLHSCTAEEEIQSITLLHSRQQ